LEISSASCGQLSIGILVANLTMRRKRSAIVLPNPSFTMLSPAFWPEANRTVAMAASITATGWLMPAFRRHSHQPPPLPLRLLPEKIPGHPHPRDVLQLDGHQHPEGTDEADLGRHDQTQARVLIGGERRQDAQTGAGGDGLLLRQHTGTAHPDRAGAGNLVEKQQVLA